MRIITDREGRVIANGLQGPTPDDVEPETVPRCMTTDPLGVVERVNRRPEQAADPRGVPPTGLLSRPARAARRESPASGSSEKAGVSDGRA